MSSFPFAEANRCRQNEWKDCQSFGTVCSSSQDSKGDFLCNIQSLISVIKNLAGRNCRWVDQTGLRGSGCLCLWGVAWYVKCSGLPYFLHFSFLYPVPMDNFQFSGPGKWTPCFPPSPSQHFCIWKLPIFDGQQGKPSRADGGDGQKASAAHDGKMTPLDVGIWPSWEQLGESCRN